MPYTVPEVVGGIGRDASIELIAEWVSRNLQRTLATPYIQKAPRVP
jgi:hypothetical protein